MEALSYVTTLAALRLELDRARRRVAAGTGKARISLDQISHESGIPRSTVHAYLSGRVTPSPQALDKLVLALGADKLERGAWAAALERAALPDSLTATGVTPHQLPRPPQPLVGRDAVLAQLRGLQGENSGRIALVGPGGVGKTALAVTFASQLAIDYPHGEIFVDLQGFGSTPSVAPDRALRRVLLGVGVNERELPDDLDALAAAYRSVLADRRLVLVLDNAADSEQLRLLLPGSTRSLVIITSRNRLAEMEALDEVDVVEVPPLSNEDARTMLHPPRGTPAALVRRLAEICDGLPLALRILAWRLRQEPESLTNLEPEAVLDNLSVGPDLGVRRILASSYQGLSPAARKLFCLLAAIPGPRLRVELAAQLAADHGLQVSLLDEPLAVHLLSRNNGTLSRHDLVTSFANEQSLLDCSDEERASARRSVLLHELQRVDAAVALTARAIWTPSELPAEYRTEQTPFSSTAAAEAFMRDEEDVLLALLTIALREGPADIAWLIAERIANYGAAFAGETTLIENLARTVDQPGVDADPEVLANLRVQLANKLMLAGHSAAAANLVDKALSTEAPLSPGVLHHAYITACVARGELGEFDRALTLAERAVAVLDETDPLYWFGRLTIATVHQMRGKFEPAAEQYRACLAAEDVPEFAHDLALLNWMDDAVLIGDLENATRLEQELLALDAERLERVAGPVPAVRAELALRRGDLDTALELGEEAAEWGREHQYRLLEIRSGGVLGLVDAHHGSTERLRAALTLTRQSSNQAEFARSALMTIEGLRLIGNHDQADALSDEVRSHCERLGLEWYPERLAALDEL